VTERVVTLALPGGGARLDKALAAELSAGPSALSRTQIQRLIEDGLVTVAGQVVTRPGFRVERAAEAQVRLPPAAPSHHAAENIPLTILFENDDLLIVNKPAGMVVHPAAGHWSGTLVNAVLGHDPALEGVGDPGGQRPGIVHRLDRDTSGVMAVAKTDAAHRDLQAQFKTREVDKRYIALVDGQPPTPTGRIEAPIGRDPRERKRMAIVPETRGGRPAFTEYKTLESFPAHTLLDVNLLTGRTHQIRLHLAYLKCPIVGDTVYGRRTPSLPLERQFLHAAQLTLRVPGAQERRTFTAPLPDDLARALDLLRR
jgi:23S rRNA pseudouridine1911/1915/1917 synthase